MAQILPVELGGKTFAVPRLTTLPLSRWQREHAAVCQPLGELALAGNLRNPTPDAVARLALAAGLLLEPIQVLDALCAYSPVLAAEREWIGDNAYIEELVGVIFSFFFGASPARTNGAATPPAATI